MYSVTISNIPKWISEIHLKDLFNRCGKIEQAEVDTNNKDARSLGVGKIIFSTEEAMHKALDLNGHKLDGYEITVTESNASSSNCKA